MSVVEGKNEFSWYLKLYRMFNKKYDNYISVRCVVRRWSRTLTFRKLSILKLRFF